MTELFLNNPNSLGSFTDGSHILKTQQIAFTPADVGVELGNWGSKSMPFLCEIDSDPGRVYQSCADGADDQVLQYFGVATCEAAVGIFPCDSVRLRTFEGVTTRMTLSQMCPLSCAVCVDLSDTFFNITVIARRTHVDIKPVPS